MEILIQTYYDDDGWFAEAIFGDDAPVSDMAGMGLSEYEALYNLTNQMNNYFESYKNHGKVVNIWER